MSENRRVGDFLTYTVYSFQRATACSLCLVRQAIGLCYRPSVRCSVCLSDTWVTHGWISQKRLKLGSCNSHHTVASSLYFLRHQFHPEIVTGSIMGRQTTMGRGNKLFLALCVNISKTVGDTAKVTDSNNRKLHVHCRFGQRSMTLNCCRPKVEFSRNFS